MKKILITTLLSLSPFALNAQFAEIDEALDRLEERKGINQHLEDVDVDGKKFIKIDDFEDHTERKFIIFNNKMLTYVEIFDDKSNNQRTSNVFSGDYVRNNYNLINIRADELDGQKVGYPVTKTLLLTKQRNILYLLDVNNKERWIEENYYNKAIKKQK